MAAKGKANQISFKLPKGKCIAGVDVGGTKMMAAIFDKDGNCLGRARKKVQTKGGKAAPEDRLFKVVSDAIEKAGDAELAAIGVGSPGPLDPDKGIIIDTPNLNWKEFPLGGFLKDHFGVPVVVDNDVNVGTYGEWCFGEVSDCHDVVGIFPGTGIGGGIILGGHMLHGFSGAAGEVGHMTIEVGGPYCGCGKRGCLEAVASRIAIAKEVAALAARGDAPHIAENCGTDLRNIRSGALARAIEDGDRLVEEVVRKAAYYVGVGVANVINVISPEAVVLGGGLVEAMEALYLEEVGRAINEHAMPYLRKGVRVVAARLGDDAVVLGAAQMAAEAVGK